MEIHMRKRLDLDIFFPGSQFKREAMFRKHLLALLSNTSSNQSDNMGGGGDFVGGGGDEMVDFEYSSDYDDNMGGGDFVGDEMLRDYEDVEDYEHGVIEFESEKPVYSDAIDNDKYEEVKKGSTFDVLSLLSKSGCNDSNHLVRIINGQSDGGVVPLDSLNGKYILLCCAFIPYVVDGWYDSLLHSLSLFAREMYARKDDVEMVLVVKVKPQWSHYPDVVTHFVKHFSCLVVPFDHHARIDSICRAANMGCGPKGILVDPNQVVIRDTLSFVEQVGMDAFPFTDADIHFDKRSVYKRKSLEQLLGHASVYTIVSNKREIASTAELGHKVVGLYWCVTGDDMPMIRNVYRQCQTKGLEFEVVVLCMPFHQTVSPKELEKAMTSVLKKSKLPWWVFPFDNSVFRRLYIRSCVDISDRLFIVLPNGKLMEPHGELVTHHFGIDAYPFTRETVIKIALDKLRRLTLESSLLGGFLYRGPDRISMADIQGKNVILRLGSADGIKSMYKLLIKNYSHLKQKDPDLEVVFACSDTHISESAQQFLSSMPWLVYLRDPSKSEFVADDLKLWGMSTPMLVAFGKDGRICSLDVLFPLRRFGHSAFPFAGDLANDIGQELNSEVTDFMHDMVWSDRSSV